MVDPVNFFSLILLTMQNLVAVYYTLWAYVGRLQELPCTGTSTPWDGVIYDL